MCNIIVRCAFVVLFLNVVQGQDVQGKASQASSTATGGASSAARSLPGQVPEAPLPGVAGPAVPGVGSREPHTADPVVCGVLGAVIVLNWILCCCCAGCGAAAAGSEEAEGDTTKAEEAGGLAAGCVACIECLASICSIGALIYCAMTGLFRAWLGGQAVSGWCLALAIISTLQLLLCICICCCASCGAAILGEEMHEKYINKHSKHLMGSHMHELVHKHKPGGTHPITEGHLPMHDTLHQHVPLVKHAAPTRPGKEGVAKYGSTQTKSAPESTQESQAATEQTKPTPDS